MRKIAIFFLLILCACSLEAQAIYQTAVGAHFNLGETPGARYSLEGSMTVEAVGLFTINTGVLCDPNNGIPQDFFLDCVFWLGIGAGFGFEVDASRGGTVAPYFILTEVIPFFEAGTFDPLPVLPVIGCKWTNWPEGTQFSIFMRLKFTVFVDS